MKQILFTLIFAGLFGTGALASDGPVSTPVLRAFHKTFTQAKEVNWTVSKDMFVVQFQYNNQYVTAYYAQDGELMVMSKNILSTQLPLMLEAGLKEQFNGYWISSVVELSSEDEVHYYVSLENADQKVILRSTGSNWSTYSKSEK